MFYRPCQVGNSKVHRFQTVVTCPGLVCGMPCAGNKADRREPSLHRACRRQGRAPDRQFRVEEILAIAGMCPNSRQVAGDSFLGMAPLRSALFPRKESPVTCLQRWIYKVRFCLIGHCLSDEIWVFTSEPPTESFCQASAAVFLTDQFTQTP
jgi:hypothetical protein